MLMKNRFVEWSKKKYSLKQRLIAVIPLGLLFILVLPAIFYMSSNIDKILNLPDIPLGPFRILVAVLMIGIGFSIGIWSIVVEFDEGEGTPAPIMPTQKLIITGPFKYCRNPMAFGTFIAYFGIVVIINSISAYVIYSVLVSALLFYIKRIEEKELEERFGQDYLEYKKTVPFIIPRRR